MKKFAAMALAFTLALCLCACEKKDAPPAAEDAWDYEVTTEETAGEYKADDGMLLAFWSYEQPVLSLTEKDGAAATAPSEAMHAAVEAFNAEAFAQAQAAAASFDGLKADALARYNELTEEGNADFFAPYAQNEAVESVYRGGDLLSVTMSSYGYWGGAHGGAATRYMNFDLGAGRFFTLNDLTDDPAALRAAVAEEILAQIGGQGVDEGYFPGYEETIRAKEDFNAGFDETGVTVVFDEYEIAPYAAGIPAFTVSYDVLAPHLNDYGAALLQRGE